MDRLPVQSADSLESLYANVSVERTSTISNRKKSKKPGPDLIRPSVSFTTRVCI